MVFCSERKEKMSAEIMKNQNINGIASKSGSDNDVAVHYHCKSDPDVVFTNPMSIANPQKDVRHKNHSTHQSAAYGASFFDETNKIWREMLIPFIGVVIAGNDRFELFQTSSANPESRIAKLESSAHGFPTLPESKVVPIKVESAYEPYKVSSMLESMCETEKVCRPKPFYMNRQKEITDQVRGGLVNWLLELCTEQDMEAEVAHLAVTYIDRFASDVIIRKSNLKLVGLTAKEEESEKIELTDLLELCDEFYAKNEILKMEKQISEYLQFKLDVPTSLDFVNEFATAVDLQLDVKEMSKYLVDLALVEGRGFLGYLPSKIAAAAIAVARMTLDLSAWSVELEKNTGYNVDQLRNPIIALSKTQVKAFGDVTCAIYSRSLCAFPPLHHIILLDRLCIITLPKLLQREFKITRELMSELIYE